jgi:rhodanese-related sulfurtransferase
MKHKLLLITLIACFAGLSVFGQHDPFQESISVFKADTVLRVHDTLDHSIIIIDLRTPLEYQGGYIEGAINYNYYDPGFNDTLVKLNKDREYLIYCASGGRSGNAFNKMKQMDFKMVYNMIGGVGAWRSAGFPLVTGGTGIDIFASRPAVVNVFPNPITRESKFILLDGHGEHVIVKLISITGKIIEEFDLWPGEYHRPEYDRLTDGLYFYQVYLDDQLIQTEKILKTR